MTKMYDRARFKSNMMLSTLSFQLLKQPIRPIIATGLASRPSIIEIYQSTCGGGICMCFSFASRVGEKHRLNANQDWKFLGH